MVRWYKAKSHISSERVKMGNRHKFDRRVSDLIHPACWDWGLPLPILNMAAKVTNLMQAIEVLTEWQLNLCAICGFSDMGWNLDHNHITSNIRGFLCDSCNRGEAFSSLTIVTSYRSINPASILDLSIRYRKDWCKDYERHLKTNQAIRRLTI